MATQRSDASNTPQAPGPAPTSGSENNRVTLFFIAAATVVLFIVLGFNFLGPEGASRTGVLDGPAQSPAGDTTGGPSHSGNGTSDGPGPGSSTTGPGLSSGTASMDGRTGAVTITAPQAPDSPESPGREAVGAPKGAAPRAAGQSIPSGASISVIPRGAIEPASATPAAPPVSR